MYRVLKPGRYAVTIVGNTTYSGRKVETVEHLINCCTKDIGFELVDNIKKAIFGLYNVMQEENVIVLQKS
jgi:hypothetical protein